MMDEQTNSSGMKPYDKLWLAAFRDLRSPKNMNGRHLRRLLSSANPMALRQSCYRPLMVDASGHQSSKRLLLSFVCDTSIINA